MFVFRFRTVWGCFAVAGALLVSAAGHAGPRSEVVPGPVPGEVLAVVDGDTLVVRARIWIGQTIETRVRLAGVDAPELRGRCAGERDLARAARDFVAVRIGTLPVFLTEVRFGKYAGRVVARVATTAGEDLTDALVTAGLGQTYAGGARTTWCGGGS